MNHLHSILQNLQKIISLTKGNFSKKAFLVEDWGINIAHILTIPSQWNTTKSFLHQQLCRFKLGVQVVRNVNFSTSEMSCFLKHKHFHA